MKLLISLLFAAVTGGLFGCSKSVEQSAPKKSPPVTVQARPITLATTTSTQDSGLLDVLLTAFEKESEIKVKVVAVGSGQALELGRRGDTDVLLTHSPDAEQKFMDEGYGDQRRAVMHNDFVIVGPASDPAKVTEHTQATDALGAIAASSQPFISRGDESGTHQKELAIWRAAQVEPKGEWYLKAGAGMAQALRIADEKRAYVLTDRATYLALRAELENVIVLEGDERLLNRYSVITLCQSKHPHLQSAPAEAFAKFLVSPRGQDLIGTYGIERFGQPLFVPDAKNERGGP